jgi:hypothetical protein
VSSLRAFPPSAADAYGASGIAGSPGSITFAAHSVQVDGKAIQLSAAQTKQGNSQYRKARRLALIPVAGAVAIAVHGRDAVIDQGATLGASVEYEQVSSASTR